MRPGHPQHVELFSLERLFWSHKRFPVNLIVKKIFLCSVLLREFVVFIFISNFHYHFLNSLLFLILLIILLLIYKDGSKKEDFESTWSMRIS